MIRCKVSLAFAIVAVVSRWAVELEATSTFRNKLWARAQKFATAAGADYKYRIETIDMPVDHFSFALPDTFKMRYLVNDTWQKGENAPIFFYTGNEGGIEVFAENTGFMWEIAARFNALLIFAEHRYYGESMPFGNASYSEPKHLGYLTSAQALADYVDLIEHLRSDRRNAHSPVIAFGGSYGGMLSAWIRIKYPHIVQGAIAASAPILQFVGYTACEAFARITTGDFRAASDECPAVVRKSWGAITNVTSTDEGRKWLSDNWKLCEPLSNATDVALLKSWLSDVYGNLAMVNYPYETDFLAPLPANPISAFCGHLTNASSIDGRPLLAKLYGAISVYANFTGKTRCVSTADASEGLAAIGWPYQACTEMVMPMCADGVNDMFEPQPWNMRTYATDCLDRFSVNPQPRLVCQRYGCADLGSVSNIVFSNGLMDPWSSGGVLQNLSASAVAVLIPEGAHHLDLRASNVNDPPSVVAARKIHRYWIGKWIQEHRRKRQRTPVS